MCEEMEAIRRGFQEAMNLLRNNPRCDGNERQWVEPKREPLRAERPRASRAQKVRVNVFEEDGNNDNDVKNEYIGRDVQRVVGRSRGDDLYKLKAGLPSF